MSQYGQDPNSNESLAESFAGLFQVSRETAITTAITAAQAQKPPKSAALQKPAPPDSLTASSDPSSGPLSLRERESGALIDSTLPPIAFSIAAWRRRNWPAAVVSLRQILRSQPWRIDAAGTLAGVLLDMGRASAARNLLRDFTVNYPISPDGWRLAAMLEWKLGQCQEAIALLNRGLAELPNSPVLHRQLAAFLGAAGELAQASVHAESASRQTPSPAAVDPLDEYLSAAQGNNRSAGRMIRPTSSAHSATSTSNHADCIDPMLAEPALIDAVCRPIASAEPAKGIERQMLLEIEWKLSRLCELQPRHADRYLALAKVQWRLGATTAAMLSLQRALRANPRLVEAHRLRARLQVTLGEIDAAIETLQSLIARRLAWPDIHYEIADLQQRCGQADIAQTHLRSALRINPAFAAARQLLDQCGQSFTQSPAPIASAA